MPTRKSAAAAVVAAVDEEVDAEAAALAPALVAARQGVRSRTVPVMDVLNVPRETHLRPIRVVLPLLAAPRAASPGTPPRGKSQMTAAAETPEACHFHIHLQPWPGARRHTGRSQAPVPSRHPLGGRVTCDPGRERLDIGDHAAPATVEKHTVGGQNQAVEAAGVGAVVWLARADTFRCTVRLPPATGPLWRAAERRDAAAAHTQVLRVDRGQVQHHARTHTLAVPIETVTALPTRSDHGEGAKVAHHH